MTRHRSYFPLAISALVALAVLVTWLVLSNGLPFASKPYEVKVVVPNAASLVEGAHVKVAGADAGRVTKIERTGSSATVTLGIDDRVAPVPVDSTARVRLASLVGENYVGLDVGKDPKKARSGASLTASTADDYVDVDQILSTLQGRTRQRARDTLQGLGGALDGRGANLNEVLGGAGGAITNISPTLSTLARERERVAGVVENVGQLLRTVGDRGDALRSTAVGARDTFRTLAASDDDLRRTIDEFPATLRRIRSTTSTVQRVSNSASPVVDDLAGAISGLNPTITRLRPAAQEGRRLLRTVRTAEPRLTSLLGDVRRTSGPLVSTLRPIEKTVCQLNPALKYLAPYARDIGTFVANLGSVTNFYDTVGHAARLYVSVGDQSLGLYEENVSKIVNQLLSNGLLSRFTSGRGYNPYPKPNTIGENTVGIGAAGPSDSPRTFTRLNADC